MTSGRSTGSSARCAAQLPQVSFHAFTATATSRVRQDIVQQLGLRDAITLVGSFDRPNLLFRVLPRNSLKAQILQVLSRHRRDAGIIYCPTRRDVDDLAGWLADEGFRTRPYHAGLSDEERHANQDAFLNESVDIIVATVAFGMGIDRSDVRFVIHAGAPQSLEHYQQEAGRAGRDGLEAECVLIVSAGDFLRWREILNKNGELTEARKSLLRDMERYAASVGCRHSRLVSYFGETFTKADCGACDYCLGELESVADPVTLARKILSGVARVGQRFGAAHVTSVLRGHASEPVQSRGHNTLSVFGLLGEASIDEMRGYIDQLIAHGLLQQSGDQYPVLQLTGDGALLLKDPAAGAGLSLARQRKPQKGRGPARSRIEAESWEGVDRALFEALRALRLRLARERGVPPYVIFHDTTLRELAKQKPTSIEALRHVYGVGIRKAEDLGRRYWASLLPACGNRGVGRAELASGQAFHSRKSPFPTPDPLPDWAATLSSCPSSPRSSPSTGPRLSSQTPVCDWDFRCGRARRAWYRSSLRSVSRGAWHRPSMRAARTYSWKRLPSRPEATSWSSTTTAGSTRGASAISWPVRR